MLSTDGKEDNVKGKKSGFFSKTDKPDPVAESAKTLLGLNDTGIKNEE